MFRFVSRSRRHAAHRTEADHPNEADELIDADGHLVEVVGVSAVSGDE